MTFKHLDKPQPFQLTFTESRNSVDYDKEKWYVPVTDMPLFFLHKDLSTQKGTSGERAIDLYLREPNSPILTVEQVDEMYAGFFDSQATAYEAIGAYYALHGEEARGVDDTAVLL